MTPIIRHRPAPTIRDLVEMDVQPPLEVHAGLLEIAAFPPDNLRLSVEYVASDCLLMPRREVRRHPKKQLMQIEASMRAFGVVQPIIVDQEYRVVCGVARLLAVRNMKLPRVPVIKLEHLNELELRAYRLADDKIAEGAIWIEDMVGVELVELSAAPFEIELTGFDTVEIEKYTLASSPNEETEEIPEPAPGMPVCRVGDLFAIGDHLIVCGDATCEENYLALMGNERARMVFADLPYNVKIAGNVSGLGKTKHGEFLVGSGEMSSSQFTAFNSAIMKNVVTFCVSGAIHYICMDWRHQLEIMTAGNANYTELKNLLVWAKTNAGMSTFYRSQHELIYVWKSGTAPHINNFGLGATGRYRTNLLTYPGCNTFRKGRNEDLALHSTVKPTQLVADLIRDVSKIGEIVLDPCSGSGTTILAAHRVRRRARCMELDPKYVDTTIRRCADKLGLKAIHVASGKTFDELAEARSDTADTARVDGGDA